MTATAYLIGSAVGALCGSSITALRFCRQPVTPAAPTAPTICQLHGHEASFAEPDVCLDCRQPMEPTT